MVPVGPSTKGGRFVATNYSSVMRVQQRCLTVTVGATLIGPGNAGRFPRLRGRARRGSFVPAILFIGGARRLSCTVFAPRMGRPCLLPAQLVFWDEPNR